MLLPCRNRVDVEEWIDDPQISMEDIHATLRDQAIVNRWLGGGYATWVHALPLLSKCSSYPIRVLELACGGADLSRRIVDEARRLGKRIEVVALDLNKNALERARELSAAYPEISFTHGDALDPPFPPGEFDIVILATFLHHLPPQRVIEALQAAARMSRGDVIAADLVRSFIAYWGIKIFARLVKFNPVSAHDGMVSVCRAYTLSELADLAQQAGLSDWRLYRHKFYRMTLVYQGWKNQ